MRRTFPLSADRAFAKVKAEEALHDLKAEAEMLNISVEQVKRERLSEVTGGMDLPGLF